MRVPLPLNIRLDNISQLRSFANKYEWSEPDEQFYLTDEILKAQYRMRCNYKKKLIKRFNRSFLYQ